MRISTDDRAATPVAAPPVRVQRETHVHHVEPVVPARPERMPGLDRLRFWAILGVVSIHASDAALRKNGYFPTRTFEGSAYYAFTAVLRFSVPVFILMSAFLARRRELTTGASPRPSRLLVPLVGMSVFYLAFGLLDARLLHHSVTLRAELLALATGQAYYHLWFLYALAILTLARPLLRLLAIGAAFPITAAATMAAYTFTGGVIRVPALAPDVNTALTNVLFCAPYYVVGIWAADNLWRIRRLPLNGARVVTFAMVALLGATGVIEWAHGFYHPVTALAATSLFILAIRDPRRNSKLIDRIAMFSLGIYVWHPLFLRLLRVPQGRLYSHSVSPPITFGLMLFEIVGATVCAYGLSAMLARSRRLAAFAR